MNTDFVNRVYLTYNNDPSSQGEMVGFYIECLSLGYAQGYSAANPANAATATSVYSDSASGRYKVYAATETAEPVGAVTLINDQNQQTAAGTTNPILGTQTLVYQEFPIPNNAVLYGFEAYIDSDYLNSLSLIYYCP